MDDELVDPLCIVYRWTGDVKLAPIRCNVLCEPQLWRHGIARQYAVLRIDYSAATGFSTRT